MNLNNNFSLKSNYIIYKLYYLNKKPPPNNGEGFFYSKRLLITNVISYLVFIAIGREGL
jgi:hypothetical protein